MESVIVAIPLFCNLQMACNSEKGLTGPRLLHRSGMSMWCFVPNLRIFLKLDTIFCEEKKEKEAQRTA